MQFPPHIHMLLVAERQADAQGSASAERIAREARDTARRPAIRAGDDVRVTLRLDRVDDASRLGRLAALSERRLTPGRSSSRKWTATSSRRSRSQAERRTPTHSWRPRTFGGCSSCGPPR